MTDRFEVDLAGFRPRPLASYLGALGVLRLVAEQADPAARGCWRDDRFVLASRLDRDALVAFFRDEWRPTPVISPWNGRSGFHPGDNTEGIGFIEASDDPRFRSYRDVIGSARGVLADLGITGKPDKTAKELLIEALRSELPDDALDWLDAALVLTANGPRFPPLLGTGGNDGNFEFSNNYMTRLAELFRSPTGSARKRAAALRDRQAWIEATLFREARPNLPKKAVGQFDPALAGGVNAGPGETSDSRVNPWTFALTLEGAMAFAATASRKLETTGPGDLVFPFSVRSASVGYGSASRTEEESSNTRDELWLPLWSAPSTWAEIRALLREGRARVGRRAAQDGVDFARAIAQLGVGRGIDAFERYAFHMRNGRSYQAVPLGRWPVRRNPQADLLAPIDRWLHRFRTVASSGPASIQRARRALDEAILDLCSTGGPRQVQALLVALGQVERQATRSLAWVTQAHLPPLPWLGARWVTAADDHSRAFRLSAGLANRGLRSRVTPLTGGGYPAWNPITDPGVGWIDGNLVRSLGEWLTREDIQRAAGVAPDTGVRGVSQADLAWWLAHPEADTQVERLALGLMLVRPEAMGWTDPGERAWLPPQYALLRLCTDGLPTGDAPLHRTPGLVPRAVAGDADGASSLALRRLRGAGLRLWLDEGPRARRPWAAVPLSSAETRRIAAALAFPLSRRGRADLIRDLITSEPDTQENP